MKTNGILCLTFDDRGFDGWEKAIPLFAKYGAHATFFALGDLSAEGVIPKLRSLRDAGHTVGIHTVSHADIPVKCAENGCNWTWKNEVKPQTDILAAAGMKPGFLAYPNNRHNDETDAEFAGEFTRYRAGARLRKNDVSYYARENTASLLEFDAVFHPVSDLPKMRVMEGVGVGEYYRTDIEDILSAIRRIAWRDEVLTIFSHDIKPDAKSVSMKTEWLERILATAARCGVAMKGFSELGPVEPQRPSEPLKIALTFDDNIKDHLLVAAPELEKRGWRGLFCVVPDWVGKKDTLLDWDDVRELVKRGHEIANHTKSHAGLGSLIRRGADRVRAEVVEGEKAIVRETGVKPRFLCLPGTSIADGVSEIIREAGEVPMLIARHGYGEWQEDPFRQVQEDIRVLRERGIRHADFLVHGISPEGGGWKPFASKAKFVEYLDGLKAAENRGEIRIVGYGEL